MSLLALALVAVVALLHLWFLVLEMLLWTRPLGLKTFRNTPAHAQATRVLAANQGLYNGFLAAGLLYAATIGARPFVLFFLGCVLVAALYGAYSVSRRILLVQGLPALVALVAVLLS